MIGLMIKDFYSLRQYAKTVLIMLAFFAMISTMIDNPAVLMEGFIVYMSITMAITSFSYDALAKWDRYALSMPVTRKEAVAAKYLISVILCLAGAVISFLISSAILKFHPVEGFGISEHLYVTDAIIGTAFFFSGILLPLIYKIGIEKARFLLIVVFATPMAILLVLSKLGVPMPSADSLVPLLKLLPFIAAIWYFLSFLISVRIFSRKEI
jgi:ABC-type transport system involved in multi-copper enzyme maturation permease subunit